MSFKGKKSKFSPLKFQYPILNRNLIKLPHFGKLLPWLNLYLANWIIGNNRLFVSNLKIFSVTIIVNWKLFSLINPKDNTSTTFAVGCIKIQITTNKRR